MRLRQWIAYHLHAGIDRLHVFFDDPADAALSEVNGLPGVTAHACDADLWQQLTGSPQAPQSLNERQSLVATWTLSQVRGSADFLVHFDSDELLWAPQPLGAAVAQEFARSAVDWIRIPSLEAVPSGIKMADAFGEVRWFKEARPERYDEAKALGARKAFRGRHFFRGHTAGKALMRVGDQVPRLRSHAPAPSSVRELGLSSAQAEDLRILHYDSGTFGEWRAKWLQRSDIDAVMPGRRQRMLSRFARTLQSDDPDLDQRRLYRREYCVAPEERRILKSLGLLRRIDIDASMFESA